MHGLEGDIAKKRLAAVVGAKYLELRYDLIDDEFRGIEIVWQGGWGAIFVPICCFVERQIGRVVVVASAGGVDYERAVKAETMRQVLPDIADPPFARDEGLVSFFFQA